MRRGFHFLFLTILLISCGQPKLEVVTIADFRAFVEATGHKTDAEKYGWTFIQNDVDHFDVVYGVDWRCGNGMEVSQDNFPVTQVSYNDAQAYANWKGARLPDYQGYWKIANTQEKIINSNTPSIIPSEQCHIIGNVWEITAPDKLGRIRLAGGSYLCSPELCNGTAPDRVLYVDKMTGNSHIGFAVLVD